MIFEPLPVNEECGSCGADIGPSSTFPWHFDAEDCRAVREPLIGPTCIDVARTTLTRAEAQAEVAS